jgi:hypothetical protein
MNTEKEKTHNYLNIQKHRYCCPKYNIKHKTGKKCGTMVCEDCLITKDIPSKTYRGGYHVICDIDKLEK